jgi:hypothetical protein
LLEPTTISFNENVLKLHKRKAVILKSQLKDGEAAILGASLLVCDGAVAMAEDSPADSVAVSGNEMLEGRG